MPATLDHKKPGVIQVFFVSDNWLYMMKRLDILTAD